MNASAAADTQIAEFDVALIGYGPAAQALSALLGRLGHRVIAFERYPQLYDLPRAGHISDEIMRLVQAVGDAERVAQTMWEVDDELVWYGAENQQIMVQPVNMGVGISGWHSAYQMWQPNLDQELHQAALRSGVEVNLGWQVTDLQQDRDGVELTAARTTYAEATRTLSRTEDVRRVRARYAIGADGASSFTRGALGVEVEDFGFNERWFGVDLEIIKPLEFRPNLAQFCDPRRPHMLSPLGKSHRRFEWMVLPDEPSEAFLDADTAWEMLEEYGVTPDNHAIARQVVYRFRSELARDWRSGRVFLAGDAAHTMPPYAGQGLCSAMRDAANLAWKLDLVLSGRASDALLDTYEQERRPHAERWTQISIDWGELSCTLDPVKAAERDAHLLSGEALPVTNFPTMSTGVRQQSQLGAPPELIGTLSLQRRVRVGDAEGLFDDIFGGARFSVVATGADPRDVLSAAQLAFLEEDLGAIVVGLAREDDGSGLPIDVDGAYHAWLDEHAVAAVINRPDFYIFGAVARLADLGVLVDELQHQLAVPVTTA